MMAGFLQGFAYGLLLSCLPWFVAGMIDPRKAVPTERPGRLQVFLRYWLAAPFAGWVAFLIAVSVWGSLGANLAGWLAGLAAIPLEIFVERRWRRWRAARDELERESRRDAETAARRAALERNERESGVLVLDPERLPADAGTLIRSLAEAKRALLAARRPDLATQADRVYTRHAHVTRLLHDKFDTRELTFERLTGLVTEVCAGAVDTLDAMASLAAGVTGIDPEFVRGKLQREAARLPAEERMALERRLKLVDDTERRLRELSARNEAALTALDDAAVAVSGIKTGRPQASIAAEQAQHELRRFIEKAPQYGRTNTDQPIKDAP